MQDTLYFFEYYAGQAWALEEVSEEYRTSRGT